MILLLAKMRKRGNLMKKGIKRIIGTCLAVMLLSSSFGGIAYALQPERDVVIYPGDGYVSLEEYVTPYGGEGSDIYQVDMSIEVQATPPTMDVYFLVDAHASMAGNISNATTAVYNAANVLLNPAANPQGSAGASKIRVFVGFFNGQAYNSVGGIITPGSANGNFYVSNQSAFPTGRSLAQLKSDIASGMASATGSSAQGLLSSTVSGLAKDQRYTAAGLASVYDTFVSSSADRKITFFLSSGEDFENPTPLIANNGLDIGKEASQEGSMRMEALLIAQALKMEPQNVGLPNSVKLFNTATAMSASNHGTMQLGLNTFQVSVKNNVLNQYQEKTRSSAPPAIPNAINDYYMYGDFDPQYTNWDVAHGGVSENVVSPEVLTYNSPLAPTYGNISASKGLGVEFISFAISAAQSAGSSSDAQTVNIKREASKTQDGVLPLSSALYYTDFLGASSVNRAPDGGVPANGTVPPHYYSTIITALTPNDTSNRGIFIAGDFQPGKWLTEIIWNETFQEIAGITQMNLNGATRWPDSISAPSHPLDGVVSGKVREYVEAISGTYQNANQGKQKDWSNHATGSVAAQGWVVTLRSQSNPAFDNIRQDPFDNDPDPLLEDWIWSNTTLAQSGSYSINRDKATYYEGFHAKLTMDGYSQAMSERAFKEQGTEPYQEDFEVKLENSSAGQLSADYVHQAYELFRVAKFKVRNHVPTIRNVLSQHFVLHKISTAPLFSFFEEGILPQPFQNYIAQSASGTVGGRDMTWKFDKGLFTNIKYRIRFYVKMVGETDPETYYPFYDESYTDNMEIRTMTRIRTQAGDGLFNRLTVTKNLPYPIIKGRDARTIVLHKPAPGEITTGIHLGIFPYGTPLTPYTPSPSQKRTDPTPSRTAKTVTDEIVFEGTTSEEIPQTSDFVTAIVLSLITISIPFAIVIVNHVRKKRQNP